MSYIQLATAHSLAPLARLHRGETTELFKALSIHRKASLTVNCDNALNHLYDLFGNDNLNKPLYSDGTGLTLHHASTLGLFNVVSAALVEATAVAQTHNAWFIRETDQAEEEFEEEEDDLEEDEDDDDSTEDTIDALMDAIAEQLIPTELEAVVQTLAPRRLQGIAGNHARLVEAVDVIAHEQGPDVLLATIKTIMPKFVFDANADIADAPEAVRAGHASVADIEEDEEEGGGFVRPDDEDEDDFEEEEDSEEEEDDDDTGEYAESLTEASHQLFICLEEHLSVLCDELGIGAQGSAQSQADRIVGTQSRRSILEALDNLDLQPSLELIMALDEKADQEHALGMHRGTRAEVGHDDDRELDSVEAAFAENEAFADNYKLIASLSKLQSALAQHLASSEVSALLITVHR